ncbi:Integrase [Pediococcus damnosus]|uniref:tyrosine-type recombinase/integrase n=1 Tax=Pediococcus damnosus TaxID=51663 RepID=UPI00078CA7D8|nr:site-specific integrase [Pediococcus damnosus]AMV59960.1 Integrase [Pediococcus damnosus]AMV64204.1 Integrase [Pediococcus damnosus]
MPTNSNIKKVQLKTGVRYDVNVRLGNDSNGKPVRPHKRFKTYTDAKKWLDKIQYDYNVKDFNGNAPITFKNLYEQWFEEYKEDKKESTYVKTRDIFKLHILPFLGDKTLDSITRQYCNSLVKKWHDKPLVQYKRFRTYVISVFNYAIRMEMIMTNPMEYTHVSRDTRERKSENTKFYNRDELNTFLDCANKSGDPRKYLFFRVLAYTGLRRGELIALRFSDIDMKNNIIHVTRTQTDGKNFRPIIQTPKTSTSVRDVPVDAQTMNYIKDWKLELMQDLMVLGNKWNGKEQFLIPSLARNTMLSKSQPNAWNKSICKRYGLRRISIHSFRHTFATLSMESGNSLFDTQKIMGHAKSEITEQIYAHQTESEKTQAISNLADYLKN